MDKSLGKLINLGGALLIECGGQQSLLRAYVLLGRRGSEAIHFASAKPIRSDTSHFSNQLLVTRASVAVSPNREQLHRRPVFVAITLSARARQARV